jgi:hypothetical protein
VSTTHRFGISRRSFLAGTGAGLAAGASAAWLGLRRSPEATPALDRAVRSAPAMPGPYPGRVVEVHYQRAVGADHGIDARAAKAMVDRGMRQLTGADHATESWRQFFSRGDIVGIKVNPVGRSWGPGRAGAISNHAVVLEVVAGLESAGVRRRDIILFDRYADQFRGAGYEALLREPALDGVRWYASAVDYDDRQVDIRGYDGRPSGDPHVVGYDPDVFVTLDYASPFHDPKDDRRFRSHMSVIVSRMIDKLVNIPVLKDHGSAGVTLALKNMSHGLHNNVARSHITDIQRGTAVSGPNQCNTFIPAAAGAEILRRKATLHLLDGLIGVYQGGPSADRTFHYGSLFFGTDPVAMDRVGWGIVDAARVRHGMAPVAQMGLHATTRGGRDSEKFDRRQPEHIYLASTIGLGVFDPVVHRRIELTERRA